MSLHTRRIFTMAAALTMLAGAALGQPAAPTNSPAKVPTPEMPRRAIEKTSADRLMASVITLETFVTRHTQSDATDPFLGIGAARTWIKQQFDRPWNKEAKPVVTTSFEEFKLPDSVRLKGGATVVNVVAVLPGKMPEAVGRRYYIVGHYDSRNDDPNNVKGESPGANDDASGTACVIEAARVLSELGPCDATIVFLATAGEEQGLLGARRHAEAAAGRNEKIMGVLSNDIVGDPSTPAGFPASPQARTHIRIFSEALPRNANAEQLAAMRSSSSEVDSPSRQLARYVRDVGETYDAPIKAKLIYRPDRFLRGGDHSAFNDAGFAAVRFTEFDEEYARQHAAPRDKDGKPSGDRSAFVDKQYLRGVAALNIATLVCLANAPTPPGKARITTEKLENGTTLRWEASPEPDVAGYEVLWRDTTDATWTHAMDVGTATTFTLNLCKDDWFFAVRAYDKDGYRSPAAFCGAAGARDPAAR